MVQHYLFQAHLCNFREDEAHKEVYTKEHGGENENGFYVHNSHLR